MGFPHEEIQVRLPTTRIGWNSRTFMSSRETAYYAEAFWQWDSCWSNKLQTSGVDKTVQLVRLGVPLLLEGGYLVTINHELTNIFLAGVVSSSRRLHFYSANIVWFCLTIITILCACALLVQDTRYGDGSWLSLNSSHRGETTPTTWFQLPKRQFGNKKVISSSMVSTMDTAALWWTARSCLLLPVYQSIQIEKAKFEGVCV